MVSVIERLNTFLTFALTHLCRIRNFEKPRSQFDEPFWIYNCDLTHILFCSHNKLMVDDPVRLSLEKSTARVDINWLILNKSSVALLWVLSSSMEEKSCSNGLSDLRIILSSTHNVQFIPETKNQSFNSSRHLQRCISRLYSKWHLLEIKSNKTSLKRTNASRNTYS
ncbi:hypothetical protein PanWU01x14_017950 [Parasponia andersonii]|uniref:Uncharacterized protein n=1 Tax=Parasponia andersonii TaxID=3476 RepID=A0A2P5DZ30_PARAD|nr:hypothetical protein PanWU01x14_017950 [Parasponia andersonii]